jgi:hypothetical protein
MFYLMISLTVIVGSCKKDADEMPDTLVTAKTNLTAEFAALNQHIASSVVNTMAIYPDTAQMRSELKDLVKSSDFVIEFSWITPAGIMQIVEPPLYYGAQGIDISGQEHIIRLFSTKEPVLSNQFLAVEGFYASVVIHPVVKNNAILGAIDGLFYPEQLLENVLKPIFEGKDFEMWVMEKGGKTLYDQDSGEIGRNLFTDPLYADFPELLAAARKIDTEESGTTTYSFYKAGTMQTVKKLTWWTTFTLYGTEWKLVWVQAQ